MFLASIAIVAGQHKVVSITSFRGVLKPIGPIAPNWAPQPILQTLVQVDWEPEATEIVPNWAPHLLRPAPTSLLFILLVVNFSY